VEKPLQVLRDGLRTAGLIVATVMVSVGTERRGAARTAMATAPESSTRPPRRT
jgi:hypothetical protein